MSFHIIGMGEWMHSIGNRMLNASDGDWFVLPTFMHLHAYNLLMEDQFQGRHFKVTVEETTEV